MIKFAELSAHKPSVRKELSAPAPKPSNTIADVRRPTVRSTRESYNSYQRGLMARRRADAKADQLALAEIDGLVVLMSDSAADADIERQREADRARAGQAT